MTYSSTVLADSPLAYWRLGDAVGSGTAVDSSGNGSTCTVVSGTLGATGLLSGDSDTACSFNGTSDYLTNPNGGSYRSTTFSVEFWIKCGAQSTENILVSNVADSTHKAWQVDILATGLIKVVLITNTGSFATVVTSNTAVDDNSPHHVVVTYNLSTTTANIYIDGVLDNTASYSWSIYPRATTVYIGSFEGGSSFFDGVLDEIAYYNLELDSTQIAAHYSAGTSAGTLITVTPNFVWGVRGLISKTPNFKWNTLKLISKTPRFIWNTLSGSQVIVTPRFIWNTVETVTKNIELDWSVNKLISKTSNLKWKVLSTITKTPNFKWATKKLITKNPNFKWSVLSIVTSTPRLVWGVGARIVKTVNFKWRVRSNKTWTPIVTPSTTYTELDSVSTSYTEIDSPGTSWSEL